MGRPGALTLRRSPGEARVLYAEQRGALRGSSRSRQGSLPRAAAAGGKRRPAHEIAAAIQDRGRNRGRHRIMKSWSGSGFSLTFFCGSGFSLTILAALLLSFVTPPAHAHEVRPAYLEILEQPNNIYSLTWKQPSLAEARIAIDP